jgi:hypothetical protein
VPMTWRWRSRSAAGGSPPPRRERMQARSAQDLRRGTVPASGAQPDLACGGALERACRLIWAAARARAGGNRHQPLSVLTLLLAVAARTAALRWGGSRIDRRRLARRPLRLARQRLGSRGGWPPGCASVARDAGSLPGPATTARASPASPRGREAALLARPCAMAILPRERPEPTAVALADLALSGDRIAAVGQRELAVRRPVLRAWGKVDKPSCRPEITHLWCGTIATSQLPLAARFCPSRQRRPASGEGA